ncbi:hypothetical protein RU98_GL001186 [Enterococcus caccae]|nr:hypothetical protein RU98_GL001186 [Enterococcus caccae]
MKVLFLYILFFLLKKKERSFSHGILFLNEFIKDFRDGYKILKIFTIKA